MQKILSFGEVLWDVINGQAYIGGAPFNLAGHLAQLGEGAFLYSKVGGDSLCLLYTSPSPRDCS